MLRRIAIGGVIAALALGPAVGTALATVRADGIWVSAQTYPRALHATGNHRFTVTMAIQNRRNAKSQLSFTVSDVNLVFNGRMMVDRLAYGAVTVQPPAIARYGGTPTPSNGPAYMCFLNDANDLLSIGVTMPAHTKTTLRVELTVVSPYWLEPFPLAGPHPLDTVYEPDVSWWSSFAHSSFQIPVPQVRMTGPPGEEIVFDGPGQVIDDPLGAPFPIGVATVPPAPNRLVVLTARHWLGHSRWKTVPVARVRTDSGGMFNYQWVPKHSGYYQIVAHIRHPPRGVQPDGACGPIAHIIAR